ncbi:MAG: hypothetical protein MPJ50_14095 [Pirellulales bacterium]|nr:hypothetical protein [Pirellulales bacterium]
MYDIELRYVANYSVTAFHAATHGLMHREFIDPHVADSLQGNISELRAVLDSYDESLAQFIKHAPPLAGQIDHNLRLGQVIFRKCSQSEDNELRDAAFARAATALEFAVKSLAPGLLDELEISAGPLRAKWEVWGPRLLTAFAKQTSPQMLPARADVFLAPPWTGAYSRSYVPYNAVLVEPGAFSMGSNVPQHGNSVPEQILSLAWALGQLNTDLPMYADNLSRGGYERVGALATIPAILTAAESLGGEECSAETVAHRVRAWMPECCEDKTAETVWNWWQTYVHGDATWAVAMIALDRMLYPACRSAATVLS